MQKLAAMALSAIQFPSQIEKVSWMLFFNAGDSLTMQIHSLLNPAGSQTLYLRIVLMSRLPETSEKRLTTSF